MGRDGCIYAIARGRRVLKIDNGVIYSIPRSSNQVLAIDPLGELLFATKTNMEEHPKEFGFLFRINATDI